MNTHGRLQTTTPQNIELLMMEGKIRTKQVLARKRLSTISEWEEHEVAERQANAEVSETHQSRTASEMLPGNQRQDSRTQSNTAAKFPAVLRAAYSECSTDTPLKGTPWEDAAISSVTHRKSRQPRRKRSIKEEELIEFWLNFFG